MPYKGKFSQLKNPHKYVGDPSKITYRSHWERNVMRWCDQNENIIEWASEEIVIPYIHPLQGRRAKYYPDFYLKMKDGQIRIIEVKPKKQTAMPPKPKRKTSKYLNEVATFTINQEKWAAAVEVCHHNNMTFEIWTEDTLKSMGILNWETDKSVLKAESSKKRPKPRTIRKKTPRPKRKS